MERIGLIYITTYNEGRAQDYWINYERGIIYFVNRYPLRQRSNVRVTYDYGETIVPHDIGMASIFLTAAEIIGGKEDLNVVYPQSTMGTVLDTRDRYEKWNEAADKIIENIPFFYLRGIIKCQLMKNYYYIIR